ncbi:MAG: TIGR00366 family protein [Polyangiaceae bacterium]
MVRIADALGRWTARVVPSAFAIAVLLTVVAFALAVGWSGAPLPVVLKGWGDGFWELLAFSMQMAVVVFSGYLLALARPVRRLLERVASLATSPRSAVVLMAVASMALAYINWGLSIVASAMLVRYVVKRQPKVDYRLLVACAYFGLGATWHAGLSASAPLLVATPNHFMAKEIGVVGIDKTLFSAFNLGLVVVVTLLLAGLAWALHPSPERTVTVDPKLLEGQSDFVPPERPAERTLANWFDHSRVLCTVFGIAGILWLVRHLMVGAMAPDAAGAVARAWTEGSYGAWAATVATQGVPALLSGGWKLLNINMVNFVFIVAAVWLHGTPASLLKAAEEAASTVSGIVLQFPLYAGIYGVFKATGLSDRIGEAFVSVSTPSTFPAIVYWYSGIVNYFVPSGGSKWAIEAPYLLKAAAELGVPAHKVVLAYAWGDMATDLIQPFWALPLLAVAKIEFKEILGFLLLVFFIYLPVVSAAFLLFL